MTLATPKTAPQEAAPIERPVPNPAGPPPPPGRLPHLIDEATGLFNRLYLVNLLGEACARARSEGSPLSCALLRTNWWRGLDEVPAASREVPPAFRRLAELVRFELSDADILGRWSPGELLVVLPGTPLAGAQARLGRLLDRIENRLTDPATGIAVSLRAAAAGLPEDDVRIRYPEDLPLLAHERILLESWG